MYVTVPAGRGATSGQCPGWECWQTAVDQEDFGSETGNRRIGMNTIVDVDPLRIPTCSSYTLQPCLAAINLWMTVICLPAGFPMVTTAEVILGRWCVFHCRMSSSTGTSTRRSTTWPWNWRNKKRQMAKTSPAGGNTSIKCTLWPINCAHCTD